jgi:hypothetical protein
MLHPLSHTMSRSAFFSLLLFFAFTVSALAQMDIRGVLSTKAAPVPDSRGRGVTSAATAPTPNDRSRGVSSTATTPGPSDRSRGGGSTAHPPRQSFHRLSTRLPVPFGDPHRRREIVTIPLFYPVYLYPNPINNPSVAEEEQQTGPDPSSSTDDQALQDAYNRGAQDALARQQEQARGAQRSMDSRDRAQFGEPADGRTQTAPLTEPEPDNTPPTVFIFKDGHRFETKSYAIMGQVLFDFSSKPLRKIQLTDLDVAATVKVNDEMGNSLRLQ